MDCTIDDLPWYYLGLSNEICNAWFNNRQRLFIEYQFCILEMRDEFLID